ncbi:MAG: phosphate transport system regulatory protein PhoU, partial [Clostridiales bacterium]|nr:phosphate transport system regulatory protein PhoU [Clostridiales bacterium]
MRNRFDEQLELLNRELIELGALVETAIDDALRALSERDVAMAGRAIELDREV